MARLCFRPIALAALGLALCATLLAQDRPDSSGGHLHLGPVVPGYLPANSLDYHQLLPAFPVVGSQQDAADVALLKLWQQPEGSPRLALARADAQMSFSRFNEAFGTSISPTDSPLLVRVLNRVESDADGVLGRAKQEFARPRPYQRFQFEHVCGFEKAPVPDNASKGNSYPSGHTSFGWTAALVLALVDPNRAPAILTRGREYAESRLVCAVHYPSDLQGAMVLTSATVGRVTAQPEFQKEVACAAQEHQIALGSRKQLDTGCQALAESIAAKK